MKTAALRFHTISDARRLPFTMAHIMQRIGLAVALFLTVGCNGEYLLHCSGVLIQHFLNRQSNFTSTSVKQNQIAGYHQNVDTKLSLPVFGGSTDTKTRTLPVCVSV